MLLQVLVVVLILVVVVRGGQQAGDVPDAFGDALPEEQLGAKSQVLRVFDEAEAHHGALAGAQLVLRQRQRRGYTHDTASRSHGHNLQTEPSREGTPPWPSAGRCPRAR